MDLICPQQLSASHDESPLNSQILAFLLSRGRKEPKIASYDSANSAKVQTCRRVPMRLPLRRLTVEFLVMLCMIGLKVADQRTGCVGATWAAVVQEVKMALPREPAYTGLWDGLGGPAQVSSIGDAHGTPTAIPDDETAVPDSQSLGKRLNLGSAHYELAISGVWRWTNQDRYTE